MLTTGISVFEANQQLGMLLRRKNRVAEELEAKFANMFYETTTFPDFGN